LADLDYLYNRVGPVNYVWFHQVGLAPLADFLVKEQRFPAVIEKLQKAFPAAERKQETLEDINRRLEDIRPGFLKAAGSLAGGSLAGPTTIPQIMPSACPESTKTSDAQSFIIVRNNTAGPLIVTDLDRRVTALDRRALTIPAHSWRSYRFHVGASLRLP